MSIFDVRPDAVQSPNHSIDVGTAKEREKKSIIIGMKDNEDVRLYDAQYIYCA